MFSSWWDATVNFFLEIGTWGLAIVSFIESSFFPIPPDVLLIPLSLADPSNAWWYALVTTVSSVAGAVFGWWIGKALGRRVLERFFAADKIAAVEGYFAKYGGAALAIAGFTPIPYKLFTIASGICRVRLSELIWWSLIGRGARFFLEAALIMWLGEAAKVIIDEYLGIITIAAVVVIILGYLLYRWIKSSRVRG